MDQQYEIRVLDAAQRDLEEIANLYRFLNGEKLAVKKIDEIYSALERLETFPYSGPEVRNSELKTIGYRYVTSGDYVAVYRVIDHTVYVYHIFASRTDYPTLFKSGMFRE